MSTTPAVEEAVMSAISQLPSPESRRSYEYEWRRHREWLALENLEATAVKPRHIAKYVSTLKGAKASNGRALTVLRSMYGALVRDELMLTNPAREVKAPKVDSAPSAPWISDAAEIHKLLHVPGNTWRQRRDRLIIRTFIAMAWRRAEVARIAVEDISWDPKLGHVAKAVVKGGKTKNFGLPDWLAEEIFEWRQFAGIDSGPLFRRQPDYPRACSGGIIYHAVRSACRRAGIKEYSPHSLRRTVTTYLRENGEALKTLQLMLGHASEKTTERYDRNKDASVFRPGEAFASMVNA